MNNSIKLLTAFVAGLILAAALGVDGHPESDCYQDYAPPPSGPQCYWLPVFKPRSGVWVNVWTCR